MDSDFERVGTTKRIKVEEEDQGTNRMETLPGDIILNILSGLPISSLVQFRNYQELPKSMQYANQEVVFGFGFHPITKEYKVVKIVYFKNTAGRGNRRPFRINHQYSEVQIFTVGRSVWRSLGKADYHLVQWPTQVLVNGRLHWVTLPTRPSRIRSMVSFDLADEQFQEVPRPAGGYSLRRSNYHLLVIGGCLSAAVYCHYGKLEIWVMEEYGVMESWVLKYHIGNYVPKGFQKEMDISFKISRFYPRGRFVRVIGVLNNGEILLEYKSRALVSYNPKTKKSRDLIFPGIPKWFRAIVHHGSLNWIDAFTNG